MGKSKYMAFVVLCCFLSCTSSQRYADLIEEKERNLITDTTIVIDIEKQTVSKMPLSRLICDVQYLELETVEGAYMTNVMDVKMTDSLIYVMDMDEHLLCFDTGGKFIRQAYKKGRGHGEVNRLYDFDVDEHYLYLLDGVRSAILCYTHAGEYVGIRQLDFRATRLKKLNNGGYMFELSPFTLDDEDENYEIAITDSAFNIRNKYFETLEYGKAISMTRTPYFENSMMTRFFAPLLKRSIYQLQGYDLFMKYYLDFKTPYFEPSKAVDGFVEANEKGLFYTDETPLCNKNYLLQSFTLSKDKKGLLVINLQNNNTAFIRDIENDMDNVLSFDFRSTYYYNFKKDLFVSVCDVYYLNMHEENVISEVTSHLCDSVTSLLVRDGDEINPVLMFYRLRQDILK